jgi:hypothetical protein
MIDGAQLKRLLLIAALLLLVVAGASVAFGAPLSFAGGLALGYILGAAPVASWAWIVHRALASRRGKVLAVVLLVVKLAFYSGALYLGVLRQLVSPVGVFAGMLGVLLVLIVGVLWKSSDPAKEIS